MTDRTYTSPTDLYDHVTSHAPAAPDPAAPAPDPRLKLLYPTMFEDRDVAFAPVLETRREDLTVLLREDTDQQADRLADYASMRTSGLDQYFLAKLAEFDVEMDLAEARGVEPLDDADLHAITHENHRKLVSTYGLDVAEDLVRRTQAFVAAHPVLAAICDRPSMAARPDLLLKIIEHVRHHDIGVVLK